MGRLEEFRKAKRNHPSFKQFRPSVIPHAKDFDRNRDKNELRKEIKNLDKEV